MLELRDIHKDYVSGGAVVHALKGISIEFGAAEFVAILGPSGCGKTTLLNILGGLDRYTSGNMLINGRSTSGFTDKDWDTYRNHSVGFVFQSYNLIMHQSVLRNVELALTISGVLRAERTERAQEALASVGLLEHIHKKPGQLSGGQMQRVAIARAIVNNPEIILADEPTGALDTETSIQVMEILKQLSQKHLVIMVTHNPELAERYATRIVRLQDGAVVSDGASWPLEGETSETPGAEERAKGKRRMSFVTALGLSLNNLKTKKGRTLLTAFAGSIGIIGIALILSLSNGANEYIQRVEEDTLSSYPITLESTALDMGSLMTAMGEHEEALVDEEARDPGAVNAVTSDNVMTGMITRMTASSSSNDLTAFKAFLDDPSGDGAVIRNLSNDIQYGYPTTLYVYSADTTNGVVQVNPATILESLGMRQEGGSSVTADAAGSMMQSISPMAGEINVWKQLVHNESLLKSQYEVLAGRLPEAYDEVVLIVAKDGSVSDYVLYALGLKDQSELSTMVQEASEGGQLQTPTASSYELSDFVGMQFKLVLPAQFYKQGANGTWTDVRSDDVALAALVGQAEPLTVVGVVRPSANAAIEERNGSIGYTAALTDYVVEHNAQEPIVLAQEADPRVDVFTGLPFDGSAVADTAQTPSDGDLKALMGSLDADTQAKLQERLEQAQALGMDDGRIAELMGGLATPQTTSATYEGNLEILQVSSLDEPTSISIYAKDFDAKEQIMGLIDGYNAQARADGAPEKVIQYGDYVGLMMSSVRTVIDAISYILIAFVAISLVVSSIMIGIITYISVLERTKEIGILRSIGASKRDVSRVFNAETFVIGLFAGVLGIGVTLLLLIPINMVVYDLTGIVGMARLPWQAALVLVLVSVVLTYVGGLIPARMAARRDPVTALRSE